jgi:hypothetical protein
MEATSSLSPPSEGPTACQRECSMQQKALTACVDSIRAARENQSSSDGESGASSDTPECLLGAVAAWTKCCEEANLREMKGPS